MLTISKSSYKRDFSFIIAFHKSGKAFPKTKAIIFEIGVRNYLISPITSLYSVWNLPIAVGHYTTTIKYIIILIFYRRNRVYKLT